MCGVGEQRQIDVFYEDEGRLRWAYQRNGGAWNKQTVDGSAGRVVFYRPLSDCRTARP